MIDMLSAIDQWTDKGKAPDRASAALALLDVAPHRLRRAAMHLPARRLERGLLFFTTGS